MPDLRDDKEKALLMVSRGALRITRSAASTPARIYSRMARSRDIGRRFGRSALLQSLLLPFLAIHVAFFALWFYKLILYGPSEGDWSHLKIVADYFRAGEWSNLYETGDRAINPGYLWRYPPYALYLVAPLAWVPPVVAYALLAGVALASMVTSLVMLRRLAPPAGMDAEWSLAAGLSAPSFSTLVTGQSSGVMLLCLTVAARLFHANYPIRAYALLALFALKPNWGIFFGLFALVRRDYRGALVMGGIVLAMCVVSIPLGTEVWREFFRTSISNAEILNRYAAYKQISLKSFIDSTLGQNPVSTATWVAAVLGLSAIASSAWRVPGPAIRHVGLVVLLAVAANPYASFYDALVIVLPATVWWAERPIWRRLPWLVVGWLIAAIWCWQQYAATWVTLLSELGVPYSYPPFSIVGPAVSIWLVIASREAIAASRREFA